jgi:hypothetical protein
MTYRILLLTAMLATPALAGESARSTYSPGSSLDFGAGLTPPVDGLFLREDFWYFDGDLDGSIFGGAVTAQAHLKAMVATTRLFWYPGWTLMNARYGAFLSIALADSEVSSKITTRTPGGQENVLEQNGTRTGFSDLYVTPLSLGWKKGNWHYKWTETLTLPVADYSTSEVLNLGRNYVSLNSSIGITYREGNEGLEFNLRTGFIVNDENPDTNYRTGNEVYADGSLTWRFTPSFTAGLTGSAYRQVTGDSGEGAVFGDFEGRVYAAGPVFRYFLETRSGRLVLIAKWLHQFESEYHFEGDTFMVSLVTKL